MHIQQVRMHGGGSESRKAYGDRVEIVADCGSWLPGSDYTPYREKARADTDTACTPKDISDARELIDAPSFADDARGRRRTNVSLVYWYGSARGWPSDH